MKTIIIFLLIVGMVFPRPCCPEDPKNMTFQFIRDNPEYLIGNHRGDCFSPPFRWWFWNSKINGYSIDGEFVMGMETKHGCVINYSEIPYDNPTLIINAKEEAINRIWIAENMPRAFFKEILLGNIKFHFEKHSFF